MKARLIHIFASVALTLFVMFYANVAHSSPLGVTKTCGTAKITLQCATDSTNCSETKLSIKDAKGKTVRISEKPKGLEKYTPVGIACATSSNHTNYFVVQYGERPQGCAFCEWYHIYTLQGELLTHSNPAVLTDKTLPEGQQQYPNNKEYNETAKRLGLDEQDIQLIR